MVALVGEAGIGKSRLAAELAVVLGDRATVLAGRCPAHGRGMTYWPLRPIVEQVTGDRPIDEVAAWLGVPPSAVRQVAAAVGLREGGAGEDTAWAFLRVIEGLARRRPLVLVLDDAHLAEPALVELLADMAERVRGAPVLVVAAARRDALDERHRGWETLFAGGDCLIELGPLSRAAVAELLDAIEGGSLALAERERIAAAAGGNPLFLEQLVAWLGERGAPAEPLPPALHALLASRLDRLEATERSVLALGSVVGDAFEMREVHALADGVSRAELEQACERLVMRDLLVRGDGATVRFATASCARSPTRRWRRRRGPACTSATPRGWSASAPSCRRPTRSSACTSRRPAATSRRSPAPCPSAWRPRRAAGSPRRCSVARSRGDLTGEIGFLERAVALLGADRPEGIELVPTLVAALIDVGDFTRAERLAQRAMSTSAALALPGVEARSAIERERIRLYRHPESFDVPAATAVVRRVSGTLRAHGDALGERVRTTSWPISHGSTGDAEGTYAHAERMLAHARRAESGVDIATALLFMAWCLIQGPCPVPEAIARFDALDVDASELRAVELDGEGMSGGLRGDDGPLRRGRERHGRRAQRPGRDAAQRDQRLHGVPRRLDRDRRGRCRRRGARPP